MDIGEGFARALGGEVLLCVWGGDYRQVSAEGGFDFLIEMISILGVR